MGSKAPVGETVRAAGRRGMIAADGWQRQKGFSGGKSRPAVIVGCSRPLRARDRSFLARLLWRSRRLNGNPLGGERNVISLKTSSICLDEENEL